MKKTILTTLAVVSACCAASANAADLDGSFSVGGSLASIHGQNAKFNEYRALGDGVNGSLDLNYRDPNSFFDVNANFSAVEGKQPSQDVATDNNFKIKGGMSDLFKLSLFYDEVPHNLTFGARTYFNGVGSNQLSSNLTAPSATTAFNNVFDYAIKRSTYGAEAEISLKTPFFFTARVDRTDTRGIQPFSFYTSLRELPAPVDYTTDNLFLQTGYRSKDLIVTVDGTISNFMNSNDTMSIQQGALLTTTLPNTAYLPPDNRFYKVGGSVMYRLPLWSTVFMARGSHSIMESSPLITDQSNATTTNAANVWGLRWNGLVTYDTANATITSSPIKNLDLRLFYNYLNRENDGDTLGSTAYNAATATNGSNNPVTKYHFHKQNVGLDASYKLPASTKVSTGYEFAQTIRGSFWTSSANIASGAPEANKTTDHTIFLQAKNELFDWVSAKLRYEHQFRKSDYPTAYVSTTTYAATDRDLYFREFESADKNMDAVKVEFEFEPINGLDLGLQYALKLNKYTNSPLGVQDDTRHEFYADASYNAGFAKLSIYGELETVETNSTYYTGGTTYPANANFTFFWTSKRKDINYAFGGKVEADIVKDLLTGSVDYRYEKADGSNDFTTSYATTIPWANVSALDDYTKHSLNTKLTFKASKNLSVDLGYLYENLKYSDAAYDGYTYVPAGTTYALSGAYANPNYDASVVYTKLTYKF